MSKNQALTRIKQLCCLGLDGHAIMPTLLQELHGLIPSYANAFMRADERQQLTNVLFENPEEMAPQAPLYVSEFYNRRENEVIWGFTESLCNRRGVLTFDAGMKVDRRAYYRHDYYNLVLRPTGIDQQLKAIIDEGGPALAAMILQRAPGDPDFTASDSICLGSITPYLAHTLAAPPPAQETPLVDSEDEGLLIVDVAGKIKHLSREAQRLLYLAVHANLLSKPSAVDTSQETMLPPQVVQLCQRLADVFAGQGKPTGPPVWRHRNPWGGFVFRAFWLNNHAPQPAALIGVTIKRQEPLPLKLLRQLEQLPPLSSRQTQVCLLLAAGHSRPAIARRLDVSEHTAITYTRQVYDKLQVHNRGELVNKLLLL